MDSLYDTPSYIAQSLIALVQDEKEDLSMSYFTETIGGAEWIMFGTESTATIVAPRGLKNESCDEWILGRIMPSHFRFHSMAEFIEPPTWTAFPHGVISGRVNRAISTTRIQV